MSLSETRKGEIYIYAMVLLWSLFPIITQLSYASISPLVSLGWSLIFAALFFALVLTIKKSWGKLKDLSIYKDILLGTLFLGVIFYVLFYLGLKSTSAGNASLVALMEVFFSYLFFNFWKKEYISFGHTLGAIFMVLGAAIILFPQIGKFHSGDWLILLATACAPFGNYYQQKARKNTTSEVVLFIRTLVSIPIVFIIAKVFYPHASLVHVGKSLVFLLINGILLLGLTKIFWVEAIHRISVTKAISLSSLEPIFVLFFAYLILGQIPTKLQLLSFIPLAIGLYILTKKKNELLTK